MIMLTDTRVSSHGMFVCVCVWACVYTCALQTIIDPINEMVYQSVKPQILEETYWGAISKEALYVI